METFVLADLQIKYDEAIAVIEIARESKLNALSLSVIYQLHKGFSIIDEREDIRVVILTGEGDKAFAAGADLTEVAKKDNIKDLRKYYAAFDSVYEKIAQLHQPVIAKVSGYAFGGGCLLALACDMIVASNKSTFSQPEVNFGFTGGAALLPRLIGRHKAAEITMLGKIFGAEEAYRLNLVNKVVPEENLDDEVMKLCRMLIKKDSMALTMIKRCIRNTFESNLSSANKYETEASAICLSREESKNAILKFINK